MRINVLTPGFTTSNGSALLFPLVVHKRKLFEAKLNVRFVNRESANLADCDVLAIDSKEFREDWSANRISQTLDLLASYKETIPSVVWFDTTDSSGTLQSKAFQFVDKYLKSQILIDKSRYTSLIYGGRIYSDYYRNTAGIEDEIGDAVDDPITTAETQKLGVSWNSGLADYSTYGPWKIGLYRRFPLPFLLRHPKATNSATENRTNDLSARFGATYSRATVRHQREQIRNLLATRLDTQKLGRRGYIEELNNTKVVLSPFGWGEITLKDFEVFLTGGMLLKPSMDHMQTWPEFYETDATYLAYDWDLQNLEERIDWAIENDDARQEIARSGQRRYIEHTSGSDAGELFVAHLSEVLSA
jgi:hypothetical protein